MHRQRRRPDRGKTTCGATPGSPISHCPTPNVHRWLIWRPGYWRPSRSVWP